MNGMDAIQDPKNPKSGEGALSLRIQQSTEENMLEVSLGDNGPGIPPENLEKIFDPFFTTKAQGTGLGLAACRKIIEHHGGKIAVDSTVGEGTTFTIKMPIA